MNLQPESCEIRAGLAEVEGFTVSGISIVTDHEKAADDINRLWERFFEESIGTKIPEKADDVIYAVYSDYQGGHEDPYRLTVGYRLAQDAPANTDFHQISVKSGPYGVMSAAGPQPQKLIETWEAIWSGDLDRAFATDFEVYGPRFFQEGVNEVLVHVGLKG